METITKDIRDLEFYTNSAYCCTENYHKVSFTGLLATDGGLHVLEHLRCFWIADVVGSYIPKLKTDGDSFYTLYVVVKDNEADVYIDDGNYNVKIYQHIEYTDLKENVKLFISKYEDTYLLYLPSEY